MDVLATVNWAHRWYKPGESLAVNSAIGRIWPTNLERDPRVTVLVFESGNPYHYVEIRGQATASRDAPCTCGTHLSE